MEIVRKCAAFIAAVMLVLILVPAEQAVGNTGKPFLHPLFGNNMVLQRDVENIIWGYVNPGENVSVEIGGIVFDCKADSSGKWAARIEPFSAGGPYVMKVTGVSQEVMVNDIYFGEVWLISGQSNAAMQLPFVENGDEETQNSDIPDIRFFTTPYNNSSTPQSGFGYGASWYKSNPQTVGNLSAIAYFFARELNIELDIPIGIISSSVGGSQIESWISNDALSAFIDTVNDSDYRADSPSIYYNGMIAPIAPCKIKGVLWYQGESDTQFDYLYGGLLSTLISDWRSSFGVGDLPFIVIQLPNFLELQTNPVQNEPWAVIREGQLSTVYTEENVGLVTSIDIGDAADIHPKNKQDLGKRSALCALGNFYGKDIEHSGPFYSGMSKEDNKIRISFSNADSGLMVGEKQGLEPVSELSGGTLKGFAIAGDDGNFVWADAVIEGQTVVVSSESIADPVAVRYSWASNPLGNLYNRRGLPASPFRTDGVINVGPAPEPTPTEPETIVGDLNGDGKVNSTDCTFLKRYLLSIVGDFPVENDLHAGDLNCDGKINSTDLTIMKRYLLKIIKELPYV